MIPSSDGMAREIGRLLQEEFSGYGIVVGGEFYSHVDVVIQGSTITIVTTNSEAVRTFVFTATVRGPV